MTSTPTTISPGLAFMLAASNGMPSTLGDRSTTAALGDALLLAIRCKMKFDRADMAELWKLRRSTSVGVFRPTDTCYYTAACRAGGTFAGAWEKHHETKPWVAPIVLEKGNADILANNRVAPGLGVLVESGEDPELATLSGRQVWWCTSMSAEGIVLCRYAPGLTTTALRPSGSPTRIKTLTRASWPTFFASAAAVA